MNTYTGTVQSREEWIAGITAEEMEDRDMTAEEIFDESENLVPVQWDTKSKSWVDWQPK